MSELESKKKKITTMYNELKKSNDVVQQLLLGKKLTALCVEVEEILEKQPHSQENFRWLRQINDIKKKAMDIEKLAEQRRAFDKSFEKEEISGKMKLNRDEMSKRIVRSIIFNELTSKQMKISNSELEKLANRMEGNLEIMKEIEEMIHEQGEDLGRIEDNISRAYIQTNEANQDLKEAADLQTQNRLRKIRMGFMGILAAIGWGIVGIPGMILGLFTGWKATKKAAE